MSDGHEQRGHIEKAVCQEEVGHDTQHDAGSQSQHGKEEVADQTEEDGMDGADDDDVRLPAGGGNLAALALLILGRANSSGSGPEPPL